MRRLPLLLVAALVWGLVLALIALVLVAPLPSVDDSAPAGLRRVLLGESHEGRPIKAYRLGDPASENVVLVVGCIHGNECAGKAVITALKKRPAPKGVKIWMIEALNPDGAAAGTRQNARGVDLNRNFPRKWRRQGQRWSTYYSGPRRASEKETRHAMRFAEEIRPDVTIWYHQPLALVDRSGGRRAVQRRYADLVGLPLKRLDPLPGTATRWQNHRFDNSTSFVVELPGGAMSARSARVHARAVVTVGKM
jgi:protein MpaA